MIGICKEQAMEVLDVIEGQLEVLHRNLTRCKKTIGISAVDAILRERVAARFNKQL
jgi:hypothetical protein